MDAPIMRCRMRIFIFCFFLALNSVPVFVLAEDTLVLSIGRWAEWPVSKASAVTVSNGSIVRVTDLGPKLKITAKKLGLVEIRSGERTLSVFVVREPSRRLFERLQKAISVRRGLGLSIEADNQKGARIRVGGRLLRWDDWLALAEAAQGTNAEYLFEAEMSGELIAKARRYFKSLMTNASLPELAFQISPFAEVTINPGASELKSRIGRILIPYGFRIASDPQAISLEPLVRMRLIVAEFRKNMMRKLGVTWPGSLEASLLPEFRGPQDLSLQIHALEDNGWGKILASPTLLCRSGKEAEFLAGGELPIRINNRKTAEVQWKRYGVLLKFKPKADHSGRMSIGITTEVSTIDTANSVEGIPGFLTNRIESHFDISGSRTIILSGLIRKESGESRSGLPGLSHLPVLGPLFSSRNYRDNQTELVVFVTPELVSTEGKVL